MRAILLTAVLLFVPVATLADEVPVVVTPGDRVRIATVSDRDRVPMPLRGKFVGSITDFNSNNMTVVLEGGQPAIVHRDLIAGMETSVDRGSRGKHALIGAGLGLALGAALGAVSGGDEMFTAADTAAIFGILFTPIGAVFGALMPAGPTWKDVPLEQVEWSPAASGGAQR